MQAGGDDEGAMRIDQYLPYTNCAHPEEEAQQINSISVEGTIRTNCFILRFLL